MIKMQYPEQKPRMKTENGKDFVFCVVRKKWLVLTPEEWVRQNFILALTQLYHYPLSLVAVEKRIQIHELTKRFDIVVYDRNIQPHILVECKEMNVPLSLATLDQALLYNIMLQAPIFIISNGIHSMGFHKSGTHVNELTQIPFFNS